jgi:DNA-directed RNA polymerase subunit beta'
MKNSANFTGLTIKLASPDDIRKWSNGEVTKPETINYRTLKPEKDGLFCERIFGPLKDYQCHCGKYKRIRYRGIICDRCNVEVTLSKVRRERMGHLNLAAPVAHVWFFKGAPSKLSLLLDIAPKSLTSIIYFSRYLVLAVDETKREEELKTLEETKEKEISGIRKNFDSQIEDLKTESKKDVAKIKKEVKAKDELTLKIDSKKLEAKQKIATLREQMAAELTIKEEIFAKVTELVETIKVNGLISETEYIKLQDYEVDEFLTVGMGAEALLEALKHINLKELQGQLKEDLASNSEARRVKAVKRLQVIKGLINAGIDPEWMILRVLPVIPPDLRPMVQLSGGRYAASDLNDLYRRVINRNNRLKHLISLGAPSIILQNEKRMLQESVDSLIDASQARSTRRVRSNRELKSLSDMLKGKQGRFRQNLLGKRVDYSGRSVIVVGPELKLNQCGIPKDMALEMFKPQVLHQLIKQGLAPNVKSAKNLIERRTPEIFDILEQVTKKHPVLLNRAPTLHKLSIQAFMPILVEGSAIKLHPVVCSGFNADFDGDQMAVHIPLTKKAIREAKKFMMPGTNLLKPSSGSPVTIPDSKEMAIGIYYINSIDSEVLEHKSPFASDVEAITAHENNQIVLRQLINVRLDGKMVKTTVGRIYFNKILPSSWEFINQDFPRKALSALFDRAIKELTPKRVVLLIDAVKDMGFDIATISGISFAVSDNELYSNKDKVIDKANLRAKENEQNYHLGLITNEERRKINNDIWIQTTEELVEKTWNSFAPGNPIRLIIETGMGRISRDTVKQLSAMRGLTVDPLGNIIELPTKSNYREGLSIFEYVNSIRGSRKGLIDTALRTADAGYLTRKLVDVSHEIIIRDQSCGTSDHIIIEREGVRSKEFAKRIVDRFAAAKVIDPKTKKTLVAKDEIITPEKAKIVEASGVSKVAVYSPLTCTLRHGVCARCYGHNYATNAESIIGDPVGVIAAQSIGEPGTQLTMRTKHSSGAIGIDVTQGLPRVTELLEARMPKNLSPIAEVAGTVDVLETDTGFRVTITADKDKRQEVLIPLTSNLKVKKGDLVVVGDQLASGGLDVQQILKVQGIKAVQDYLITETQAVYGAQGIPIHDKHLEIIVRQMTDKVRIDAPGDATFLPGEIVSRGTYEEANEAVLAAGGEPSVASRIVLGITRTSLYTESWLSAASFQDTTAVLTDAAIQGKVDRLLGLKENVIIGNLIPVSKNRALITNI